MKLKAFLILNAILFVPFGIGMLAMPGVLFPMFGIDLAADGLLMGRIVGSCLLSVGVISYLIRDEARDAIGMRAVLVGSLIFHAIDAATTFVATIGGVMNVLGWMFSSLHFVLAVGFLAYLANGQKRRG